MASNKDKMIGTRNGIIVALLLIFAVFAGSTLMKPSDAPLAVLGVTEGVDGVPVLCTSETTPDYTLTGYDEATNTAITEATNLYRKVGDRVWSTFTLGTAETGLEVGIYQYVAGITTTDMTDNAYGSFSTFEVKCQETDGEEIALSNDEIEGFVSGTYYNKDNNAAASTIGANTAQLTYIEFYTGADEIFGNKYIADSGIAMANRNADYPNLLQLKLNSTDTDKPLSVKVVGGETMKAISCGTIVTSTTGFINYCYEAPVITDTPMKFVINIDADDTVAIATDGTANLHSSNFFINEENDNAVEWGNEDEDGNFLGTDAVVAVTMDFTA